MRLRHESRSSQFPWIVWRIALWTRAAVIDGEDRAPGRRAPGWLDGAVLAHVARYGPATVYSIAAAVSELSPSLFKSSVFRAVKRLHVRGAVGWVESINSYVDPDVSYPVHLVCGGCGVYVVATEPSVHESLLGKSAELGFEPCRIVLEVVGTCMSCANNGPLGRIVEVDATHAGQDLRA